MQSLSSLLSPPETARNQKSEHTQQGAFVSVLPTVASFFSSLSPDYNVHDKRQLSDFLTPAMDSAADRNPPASNMVQKVRLACNMLSCWVPTVRVVSDVVATLCSSLSVVQELGTVLTGGGKSTASAVPAVATFTLVALDSPGSAGALRPAPGQRGSPERPILVPDSKTLSMIGQADYPSNAFYRQSASFSHRSPEPGPLFKGYYDGGCHTITGLQSCLFGELDRYSEVHNLRLSEIQINADQPSMAALACTMGSFAKARGIHMENATIVNHQSGNHHRPAATGVVIGQQHKAAQLADISLKGCFVSTTGKHSVAGGVAGIAAGEILGANIVGSHTITYESESHAGLGAGQLIGQINDLAVTGGLVHTHGILANAGGGAGMVFGDIRRMGASLCNVVTVGSDSAGGIGTGVLVGNLSQLSGSECHVATSGPRSPAGIGAGQVGYAFFQRDARLSDLVVIDSNTVTTGQSSVAGVGAGVVHNDVERITSVRCRVTSHDKAGVGAGINLGRIDGIKAVDNIITSTHDQAGIGAGNKGSDTANLKSWNTLVNGERLNMGTFAQRNLCQRADPLVINPNCTAAPSFEHGLVQNCQEYELPRRGTVLRPIVVGSAQTLNRIGLDSSYPASAHYIQTAEIDGSKLNDQSSVVFSGHYDGQNHIIRNQRACLFKHLLGTVRNLHLVDARINSDQPAAVVACEMDGAGGIEDISINRCHVTTRSQAPAGIICGRQKSHHNKVSLIDMHSSQAHSHGDSAPVGMIAGQCRGLNERIVIHDGRVSTSGKDAYAGLGCGEVQGTLRHFSATCSQVESTGHAAFSGIAAGKAYYSRLGPATMVNCNLATSGQDADAGLAVGRLGSYSEADNFTMLNGRVLSREANAGAGIGSMNNFARIKGLTVVHCEVSTEADGTHAGIGVGLCTGMKCVLTDITSSSSTLRAPGHNSCAHVAGSYANGHAVNATGTYIVNTRVNGRLLNNTPGQNGARLCLRADPNFVNPACQVGPGMLPGGCLSPGLTIAAPASALLANGLSSGAVIGITVGTVFILGAALAGYCCYRHHRSDRATLNSTPFHHLSAENDPQNSSLGAIDV